MEFLKINENPDLPIYGVIGLDPVLGSFLATFFEILLHQHIRRENRVLEMPIVY